MRTRRLLRADHGNVLAQFQSETPQGALSSDVRDGMRHRPNQTPRMPAAVGTPSALRHVTEEIEIEQRDVS